MPAATSHWQLVTCAYARLSTHPAAPSATTAAHAAAPSAAAACGVKAACRVLMARSAVVRPVEAEMVAALPMAQRKGGGAGAEEGVGGVVPAGGGAAAVVAAAFTRRSTCALTFVDQVKRGRAGGGGVEGKGTTRITTPPTPPTPPTTPTPCRNPTHRFGHNTVQRHSIARKLHQTISSTLLAPTAHPALTPASPVTLRPHPSRLHTLAADHHQVETRMLRHQPPKL